MTSIPDPLTTRDEIIRILSTVDGNESAANPLLKHLYGQQADALIKAGWRAQPVDTYDEPVNLSMAELADLLGLHPAEPEQARRIAFYSGGF